MPFPTICLDDREKCPNEWPVLSYYQNACSTQQVTLRDSAGIPYDLTGKQVQLLCKETIDTHIIYIAVGATIDDAENGVVSVQLSQQDTYRPGLFVGEFVISNRTPVLINDSSEECTVTAKLRCYLEIQEDLYHTDSRYHTLTIAEIRLSIRDKCREDNFLLDNIEFSDTEIAWSIRRPVDYWNEALPPLHTIYNTTNFPFQYHWVIGAIGELLSIAGLNYERNRLRYTAAGLSIDDKDKSQSYLQASDRFRGEYRAWVTEKKRSLNMSQAFGSTSLRSFSNGGVNG